MKFALTDETNGYTIQSYSDESVVIDNAIYRSNLVILPNRLLPGWRPDSFQDLESGDFEKLVELKPDLVILGTGKQQQFPLPKLYQSLVIAGIGLEIMTTPAACRTYNILVSEGRMVAAALILK